MIEQTTVTAQETSKWWIPIVIAGITTLGVLVAAMIRNRR